MSLPLTTLTAMSPRNHQENPPKAGVQLLGTLTPERTELLSEEALSLLLELERRFGTGGLEEKASRVETGEGESC